jgi:hypothetical protein
MDPVSIRFQAQARGVEPEGQSLDLALSRSRATIRRRCRPARAACRRFVPPTPSRLPFPCCPSNCTLIRAVIDRGRPSFGLILEV